MQFSSKSFKSTLPNSLAAKYRKALQKHPFALFGLPFLATIVAGSFMLTPATALRYERYDRKNQQISQEEAMGLGQNRRKVNMKDEYYVSGLERLEVSQLWEMDRPGKPLGMFTNEYAETTSEGSRGLGTEAC
jgi:cytochrome c oxidase assembly protein subunit 16